MYEHSSITRSEAMNKHRINSISLSRFQEERGLNQRSVIHKVLTSLATVVTLAGCAMGPDYQRPKIDLPLAYPSAQTEMTSAEPVTLSAKWWTLYNDAKLNELVETTLTNNADIHKAIAQIDEAEAILAATSANIFPELDLGATRTKSRSSILSAQPLPPGTPRVSVSNKVTISTAFELDFWGKLRRASEAARADILASRDARGVTALTLASATTQAYFSLRALDAQIEVTQEILTARVGSLDVVKNRARGGLASSLEVQQAEGARAEGAVQLRELQRQRALLEHQLGSLTGKLSLTIESGGLTALPTTPSLPPVGLPSTLLERRPDVLQAEQSLIAANAQIGAAKAAQFPSFTLTGSYGGQSKDTSNLFEDGARIWSLGPSVSLPIFDGGKLSARKRQAQARQRQSLASYQKTVETAFREVADALSNTQLSAASVNDMQAKADAGRESLRLSRLRYEAGYSGYLEVLDAQRSANAAELALVQNRLAQLIYSVDLMKALGGGWSPVDTAAAK